MSDKLCQYALQSAIHNVWYISIWWMSNFYPWFCFLYLKAEQMLLCSNSFTLFTVNDWWDSRNDSYWQLYSLAFNNNWKNNSLSECRRTWKSIKFVFSRICHHMKSEWGQSKYLYYFVDCVTSLSMFTCDLLLFVYHCWLISLMWFHCKYKIIW